MPRSPSSCQAIRFHGMRKLRDSRSGAGRSRKSGAIFHDGGVAESIPVGGLRDFKDKYNAFDNLTKIIRARSPVLRNLMG
jgi:hypothetical protein